MFVICSTGGEQRRPQGRSRASSSSNFVLSLDGIQDAFQQQLTPLPLCTHLHTHRGLREFKSRGAHHPMFAHRRAHSSGSAQFRGILG